jgi:PhnB protein
VAITAYLYYSDVAAALRFLKMAFGLRRCGPQMRRPDGKINHASMEFGDSLVMMGCPGPKYKNPKRLGQATASLYVNVDKVDAHFARARKAGARIIAKPENTNYGARRYGAEDPEGHQWYFAQELRKRSKSK